MKIRMIKNLVIGICLAVTGMLAVLGSVRADVITLDITTGNSALSGYSPDFATVDINRTDTTHATITFTSLTAGGNIYLFGDGGTVAVNVNATSWTLGTITGSNAGTGFSPGPWSDGGSGNEDGFGKFNQTINSFDGYKSSSDTISFTLTDTSGTWAAATDVLKLNNNGGAIAAHIFVTAAPADASGSALVTGFASGNDTPNGGGTPPVPDGGSTIALLGFALLGVDQLRRRISRD